MPSQADCRDAIHWFVDNVGLYSGSVRSLFATDFAEELEPVLESAIINLKARGVNQLVLSGDALYKQAEFLWQQALRNTTFGRPVASKFELEMTGADVLIIKYLEAPEIAPQLWYLYHHVLYPRALYGRPTLFTTPLGYEEFLAYGGGCDDMEYAGRKVTWEKFLWLLDACTLDLNHLKMVRDEGLPPMLKAEYYLYKTMSGRGLNPLPQHVLDDYMLDFALVEKDRKIDVECDVIASLDGSAHAAEAKRNLVLLNDGWKIVRLSTAEILSNVVACADAVEEVWQNGRKKSNSGRVLSGQASVRIPELPVDDEVQRFAITHGGGPAALTGGAGTGKSSCIIHRVAYLIAQGINAESILVVSYSPESTKSLRHALENVTDRQLAQKVNFLSWHELGLKILKENLPAIRRKPPLKTESNNQKVIQRLLTKYKKELDPAILELSEELDEFTLSSLISLYKANMVAPKNVKERAKGDIDELVAKVYQAYEDQLQKTNRIDRDDMVTLAALVLLEQPDVRARYQYQYEYVLVDEYQDVTAAGDLLVRLLAFPQDNIFVAGDEDESIYESRGALPKLLADISIRLPNARCYVLEKNWRSHPAIVDHARQFASSLTRKRIDKDMVSGWGAAPTTAIIGPHMLDNDSAESDWVAEEVHILIDSGRNPEDIAVLYRSSRYAVLVEEALHRKGIRCIATHPEAALVPDEVGDVMAFLRLVMDPDGPKARESFERICQLRVKEIDPKLSPTIASFAEANSLSYLKAVEIYSEAVAEQSCRDLEQLVRIIRTMNQENLPPAETIALLRRTQRLNDFYRGIKVPPGVNYEPLRKLGQLEEEARKYKTVGEFVKAQSALKQTGKGGADSAVHILTLHEVKGLEFPVIFMVGMAEGIFPQEAASDLEEERRLFYVGVSRGRELLYISYPGSIDEKLVMPSSLLVEARLMAAPPPVHPAAAAQAAQAAAAAKAAAAAASNATAVQAAQAPQAAQIGQSVHPANAARPGQPVHPATTGQGVQPTQPLMAPAAVAAPVPAAAQTPMQTGQYPAQAPQPQQVPMQTGQYPAQAPQPQQVPMQTGQYPAQAPQPQQVPMQTGQYPAQAPQPQQVPTQTGQYPAQAPQPQQVPMQTGQYPAQAPQPQQVPMQTGQYPAQAPQPQQVPMQTGQYPAQAPQPQQVPMQTGQYPAQAPQPQQVPMQTGQYPAQAPQPQQVPMQTGQYPAQAPQPQQVPMQTGTYSGQHGGIDNGAVSDEVRKIAASAGMSEEALQIARQAIEAQLASGGGGGGTPKNLKKGQPGEHDAFLAAMGGPRRRGQNNANESGKGEPPRVPETVAEPADAMRSDSKDLALRELEEAEAKASEQSEIQKTHKPETPETEQPANKTEQSPDTEAEQPAAPETEQISDAPSAENAEEQKPLASAPEPVEPVARKRGRPPKVTAATEATEKPATEPPERADSSRQAVAKTEQSEPSHGFGTEEKLAVDPLVAELFDDLLPAKAAKSDEASVEERERANPGKVVEKAFSRQYEGETAAAAEHGEASDKKTGPHPEENQAQTSMSNPIEDESLDELAPAAKNIEPPAPPEKREDPPDAFDETFTAAESQASKTKPISWGNVSAKRKPQMLPELGSESTLQPHSNLSVPEPEDWEQILEEAAKPQSHDLPSNYKNLKEELAQQKRDQQGHAVPHEQPDTAVTQPQVEPHRYHSADPQQPYAIPPQQQPYAIPPQSSDPAKQQQPYQAPEQTPYPVPQQSTPYTSQAPPYTASVQPYSAAPPAPPNPPLQPGFVPQPQPQPMLDDDGSTIPHCPQCYVVLEVGAQFCGDCGYRLGVRISACRNCHAALEPGAKFCGECGEKNLDSNPSAPMGGPIVGEFDQQALDADDAMRNYIAGESTKPQPKGKKIVNKIIKFLEP